MDIFVQVAEKIIKKQETIIGPIALLQAEKVSGLTIDWEKQQIILKGNKTEVLEKLVLQYKSIFGQASVEACKEAVRSIISDVPKEQIPPLLQ